GSAWARSPNTRRSSKPITGRPATERAIGTGPISRRRPPRRAPRRHNRPMRPADVLPPTRDRALLAATLAVILLTWAAVAFASWRGREDAIDDWRYFLANLSEMAAQHADQTLAAADTVLGRVVDDVKDVAPVDG